MQFRQVTACKYIGSDGYSLMKNKTGSFAIYKDSKPTKWGEYFRTVKCAENFISSHNYIKATADTLPLNDSEVLFIFDLYGKDRIEKSPEDVLFDRWAINDKYSIEGDWIEDSEGLEKYGIKDGSDLLAINLYKDNKKVDTYFSAEDATRSLDKILWNDLFASVILRGVELRSILAARLSPDNRGKRSTRDATRNLIRVKSSNVWAYGVEIEDSKAQIGDVYVQFKDKNGGAGDVYKYYDVPLSTWRRFLSAPSKGHFLYKYLRNNVPYSKLTGDKRGKLPNAIN